jgi:hypothetical protein
MSYILLPPALRATPLINAGGKAFLILVNNIFPYHNILLAKRQCGN